MSQTTPVSNQSYNSNNDDEIDLFELFESLWQEKILIVLIAGVVTLLAVAYALAATPIYQAKASLLPPPAYAIQSYNAGRIDNKERIEEYRKDEYRKDYTEALNIEDVYNVFKANLNSLQLRNAFFEEVYLPSLSTDEQKKNRDTLLKASNNILSIKQGDAKNNPNLYHVTVEMDDPIAAAALAQQYIERVTAATKLDLKRNIEAAQKIRIDTLSVQIKSLTDTAEAERKDKINLLKEALYVAESIGLENPSAVSDKASFGGNGYIDNELIYTRGAKTLRAQLNVLEKRISDEPFIKGFRELNTQLKQLQKFKLDDSSASVVTIDEAAEVPSSPIKPKKSLIVALGVVLGGMLGVFAALIRSMIRKRKAGLNT